MRVSIIGGGGLVGSSAAFALQCGGIVSGIDLIDLNADQVKGQALDLLHGASLVADQRIRATGYEAIPESDAIVITAGLRRKPDESRLDLINRNVELFLNILGQVAAAGLKRDAHRAGRVQPGRRADVPGGPAARPAVEPGHRPGHRARHGAVPQPDRRGHQPAADAGHGPDPGRARRQHGTDLVDGPGRRPAARPLSRLECNDRRGPPEADPRQRRRGDQAQGRRGVRRGPVDPRRHPLCGPRPEADHARLLADRGCLRHPRRLPVGAHRGGSQGGGETARDRAVAQGDLGAPAVGTGAARDDRGGLQGQSQGGRLRREVRRRDTAASGRECRWSLDQRLACVPRDDGLGRGQWHHRHARGSRSRG